MKNRHRVSQVVSKLISSRAARRKILKQGNMRGSLARRIADNMAKLPELLSAGLTE